MLIQLNVASWHVETWEQQGFEEKKLDGKEEKEHSSQSSKLNAWGCFLRSPQLTLQTFKYLRFLTFQNPIACILV